MSPKLFDLIFTALITAIIVVALLLFLWEAEAEMITLTWDPPTQQHDGVRIYQKTAKDGDAYDYDAPIADVSAPTNKATLEVLGEENAVLKYQWVARAYRDDIESIDSNEVAYKVVNIPPLTPVELIGSYADDVVTLSWQQPQDSHPIDHWIIYYKKHGDFIPLGAVTDENELVLSADVSQIAPPGEATYLTFTAVAYRRSGVFSANSTEFNLIVDRRDVAPIQNLRIEVNIPL